MSLLNIQDTLQRVRVATADSRIAIFRTKRNRDKLSAQLYNSMFAGTVATQALIKAKHPDYIGSFYQGQEDLAREAMARAHKPLPDTIG